MRPNPLSRGSQTAERRVAALEAATPAEKLTLIFVSWASARERTQRLEVADWNGRKFVQAAEEDAVAFRARVRQAVECERPAGSVAAVFLSEQDVEL